MSSKKNVEKKKNEKEETKKKPKKEEQRKKKEFPLPPQPKNFKQIEYNEEKGKLFLIDYNNDIFECNIFGEKIPQFHINITGTSNYSKRLKNNFIEELKLEPDVYFPKLNKFEVNFLYQKPLYFLFINKVKNQFCPYLVLCASYFQKRLLITIVFVSLKIFQWEKMVFFSLNI
jgi:hypothetical protein